MLNEVIMKKVDERLAAMTLEQKLGHIVVCRMFGSVLKDEREYVFDKMRRGCIGAMQISTAAWSKEYIRKFREESPVPFLVCADMESGFPGSERKLPSLLALAAAAGEDEELAYQFGRITAIEAKAAGFNLVWGPVVDLIGSDQKEGVQRKFGSDPYKVARMAELIAKGYTDEGMYFTAKHCPGGSDAYLDTHLYANNFSYMTEEELLEKDLIPYIEMMKHSTLLGIMTNHKKFPNIDPDYPPTLSAKIVSMIRRTGFDGVLMTDSLGMVGLINEYGEDACIGQSIQAGHDMIIPNYRIPYRETMERLERAYHNGVITPERLDEAVRRVLIAQEIATKPATQNQLTEKELVCLDRLNSDSICTVTEEGVTPDIDREKSHLFVVLTENLYKNANGETSEVEPVASWKPAEIKAQLLEDFPNSKVVEVSEWPSKMDMHDVSYYATLHDDIVFVTFCKWVPYGVHDKLTLRVIRLMDALKDRIAAVLHVGNPFAMEEVPHVPRIIIGFSGGECEKYALEVLAGKRKAKGKLPVTLDLK